jgi:hypothetical protein
LFALTCCRAPSQVIGNDRDEIRYREPSYPDMLPLAADFRVEIPSIVFG